MNPAQGRSVGRGLDRVNAVVDEVDRDKGIDDGQDANVHPIGRALRSTFGTDNHDTLGSELTGLMIDLSRVPFDANDHPGPPAVLPTAQRRAGTPPAVATGREGRFGRLLKLLRGR